MHPPPTTSPPTHPPTTTAPPPPTTAPPPATTPPPPTTAPPLPPPSRPFSWQAGGAFVWHETDIDPEALGRDLRESGFGWAVIFLHDGTAADPVKDGWVERFRRASGLPVGGWGVLRERPEEEAALAARLVAENRLDFYVANPELEYGYSGPGGPNGERYERSGRWIAAFRAAAPALPAAVSSYCRPDQHDLDWHAWASAGFPFLPQAYVNDLGAVVAPAECVLGARKFFPRSAVHPMVGMHPGALRNVQAAGYVRLLRRARTVGFSVYLAETRMTAADWQTFGQGIADFGIAS